MSRRRTQIDVARFEADHAAAIASYARIQAPYDGVVTRRKIDTGQLTTAGTSGEPLYLIARTDVVTISVGVPESEAPFVNAVDAAAVRLLALDGRAQLRSSDPTDRIGRDSPRMRPVGLVVRFGFAIMIRSWLGTSRKQGSGRSRPTSRE